MTRLPPLGRPAAYSPHLAWQAVRQAWRLVLALLLCVGWQGHAYAQGPAADTRPLKDLIGVNVKFSQGQPLSDLPLLEELGVTWVRDVILWQDIEPSPGQYVELPRDLRLRLRYYKARNIGVIVLLVWSNPKAYPDTADQPHRSLDPVAYGRFAAQATRQLQEAGVRFVLEVWNEPHNNLVKPFGGTWNGAPPSPWVTHYVRMVAEVVRQVKAIDPAIEVMSDDDMWIVHYWFLEAGLPLALDGFAIHPYSPTPEQTAVGHDTDWTRPFQVVDPDRSFQSAVRRLKERGRLKLGKLPKIWVTEWGWGIGGKSNNDLVTEDYVAALLPRAYITAHVTGVEVMAWFSMQDSVDGPMGLLTNDGRRRKGFQSLKTLSTQLGNYRFVRQLIGQRHLSSGIQAHLYRHDTQYKVVIWNIDDRTVDLPLTGTLRGATAIDAMGDSQLTRTGADPIDRRIRISRLPLYLTLANGPEAIELALSSLN